MPMPKKPTWIEIIYQIEVWNIKKKKEKIIPNTFTKKIYYTRTINKKTLKTCSLKCCVHLLLILFHGKQYAVDFGEVTFYFWLAFVHWT